jgi:hypothetical protein
MSDAVRILTIPGHNPVDAFHDGGARPARELRVFADTVPGTAGLGDGAGDGGGVAARGTGDDERLT